MRLLPIQLLRLIVLFMLVFFAHFLGRAIARLRRQGQPLVKALTWILRTSVALLAIVWTGGLDYLTIVSLLLAAVSFAWGMYRERHPPHAEEYHLSE